VASASRAEDGVAPSPGATGGPSGDASAAAPPRHDEPGAREPPVAAPEPIDVTVEGDRAPPGARSLGRREIREMPGVLGDAYRAIETEPGVLPVASGVPYYFIRGAPPGNVAYAFDGVPVPLLFHAGAGPGVIPAGLVERVELHLGPLPARYGRAAGAVVDAESRAPADRWRGEGSFRLVDLGGLVEGPIAEGQTLLVGGRYSVGTELLNALVPSVALRYADYQARYAVETGPRERFTALAFGSVDYLSTTADTGFSDVLVDSDFHRLDLRFDAERTSGTRVHVGATLGLDRSRGVGVDAIAAHGVAARAIVTQPLGGALLRAGADLAIDAFVVDPADDPECPTTLCEGVFGASSEGQLVDAFRYLFPDRTDLAIGGFVEATIALGDRATITPGLRVDAFFSPVPRSERPDGFAARSSDLAVDPRLVGRFEVAPWLRLVPGVGLASQPPGFAPIPGMKIGGLPGGLQRALQTSLGAEASVGPFDLRSTVFRQVIFGLTDPVGGDRGGGFGATRFLGRSTGDSFGLEVALRGALRPDLFVLAAYTLSRTDRIKEGQRLPSAYDRSHVAQLAILADLGRGFRLGTRSLFYTGFPAEELNPYLPRTTSPERVRPFYRADLRASKRWLVGDGAYWGIVADLQNVFLAREIIDVTCSPEGCRPRELGPITIPTLALEAGF
jgi:hypothetical protein